LFPSYVNNDKNALKQTLLIQDGKLYGRDLICDVISRALSLPDIVGDTEFQTNEFVVQLGQVSRQDYPFFKLQFIITSWLFLVQSYKIIIWSPLRIFD
jgi:hypothetical protein